MKRLFLATLLLASVNALAQAAGSPGNLYGDVAAGTIADTCTCQWGAVTVSVPLAPSAAQRLCIVPMPATLPVGANSAICRVEVKGDATHTAAAGPFTAPFSFTVTSPITGVFANTRAAP